MSSSQCHVMLCYGPSRPKMRQAQYLGNSPQKPALATLEFLASPDALEVIVVTELLTE